MYHAVIILGGTLNKDSTLPDFVVNRLDKALEYRDQTQYYIVSSRNSYHRETMLDKNKKAIDESAIMGNYLLQQGISPNRILMEAWSLDTVGNAYGVLTMHCLPRSLTNILVITSDFHIQRAQAIFTTIFALCDLVKFQLSFDSSYSNIIKSEKEKESLEKWRENSLKFKNLQDIHEFIFTNHNAYSIVKSHEDKQYSRENYDMYGV